MNEFEAHEGSYDHLHKKVGHTPVPTFISFPLFHCTSRFKISIQKYHTPLHPKQKKQKTSHTPSHPTPYKPPTLTNSFPPTKPQKRLKEMKQMSRDPHSRAKALRAERRADEKSGLGVITIKPLAASTTTATGTSTGTASGGGTGKGFKKGGFKNAFGPVDDDDNDEGYGGGGDGDGGGGKAGEEVKEEGEGEVGGDMVVESESEEEEGEERYDPRFPTGCSAGCKGRGD